MTDDGWSVLGPQASSSYLLMSLRVCACRLMFAHLLLKAAVRSRKSQRQRGKLPCSICVLFFARQKIAKMRTKPHAGLSSQTTPLSVTLRQQSHSENQIHTGRLVEVDLHLQVEQLDIDRDDDDVDPYLGKEVFSCVFP